MKTSSILIVEDEAVMAEALSLSLERLGYKVADRVTTGEAAIEMAVRLKPNVVLMDISLAGEMDGIQAAGHIRERADSAVIFLSAYTDDDTLRRAKGSDAFAYLVKPFDERELKSAIEIAMYKARVESDLRSSRQFLYSTLSNLQDGVLAFAPDGHLRFANKMALEQLGLPEAGLATDLHFNASLALFAPEAAAPIEWEALRHSPMPGMLAQGQTLLLRRELSAPLPVEVMLSPMAPTAHETEGVLVVVRDVSQRYQTQKLLSQLSQGLFGVFGEGFLRQLAKNACCLLEADAVLITRLGPGPQEATAVAHWADGEAMPNSSFVLTHSPCGHVVAHGRLHVPAGLDAHFPRSAFVQRMGFRAYYGLALAGTDAAPIGTFALFSRRRLEADAVFEQCLRIFADRAAAELLRLQMEGALARKHREQQAAFDAIPMLIQLKDKDSRVVYANRDTRAFIGSDTPTHTHAVEELPPQCAEKAAAEDAHIFESRLPMRNIIEEIQVGPLRKVFQKDKIPILDEAGQVSGIVVVAQDISERLHHQRELEQYRNRLEEKVRQRTLELETARAGLEAANERLEATVAARTAELSALNESLLAEIAQRKRIEVALRGSETLYRSTIGAMEEGILIYGRDGGLITANLSAGRLLGMAGDVFETSNILWLATAMHDEAGEPFAPDAFPLLEPFRTQRAVTGKLMGYRHTNTGRRWLRVNALPVNPETDAQTAVVVATFADITERFQAEEALRTSHEMLAAVFQNSADGLMVLFRADGAVRSCNKRAALLFRKRKSFVGLAFSQVLKRILTPDDAPVDILELLQRPHWTGELCFEPATGHSFWGDVSITELGVAESGLCYLRITDISVRKKAERQLLQLESALNYARDAVLIANLRQPEHQLVVEYANAAFRGITLYSERQAVGLPLQALIGERSDQLKFKQLLKAVDRNKSFNFESVTYRKDGETFVADWSASPVRNPRGRPATWIIILRDVTLRKREEAELQRQREAQQNAVNRAMIDAQEAERARIAEDLHDGLGHNLSVLKMNFSTLLDRLASMGPSTQRLILTSQELLDETTTEVRNISRNLTPNLLYDFGLVSAIRNLCKRIELANQLGVNFLPNGLEGRLPEAVEISLYRIIQELLNNTVKYAQAQEVDIQLTMHQNTVMLIYEDDGKGFDATRMLAKGKGMGLKNIEARTKLINGSLTIDSQPGHGTTVVLEVPLGQSAEQATFE